MLTEEQALFCLEYHESGDWDHAMRAAFPDACPGESIQAKASRSRLWREIMQDPTVQEYLAFLHQESSGRGGVPLSDHLFDLTRLKGTMEEYAATLMRGRQPGEASAAASLMATVVKTEELRGRASGLYTERKEVSGPQGGPIPGSVNVAWV